MSHELDSILDILESDDDSSATFFAALDRAELIAAGGSLEAAEAIAEIFAFSKVHRDAGKAYLWYQIALASQGYSAVLANQSDSLEQYWGPVGDFRNEAQVNGLLAQLSEARIRELDAIAREWLGKRVGG